MRNKLRRIQALLSCCPTLNSCKLRARLPQIACDAMLRGLASCDPLASVHASIRRRF